MSNNNKSKKNEYPDATAAENCAALFCLLSHDLRNPLSSVITTSNFFLESYSLLSEQKKISLIEHINVNSKELLERLENIFSISKIVDNSLVFTDEAIETIIPLSIRRVRLKIPDFEVHVTIPPKMLIVSMDFVLMEHTLMLFFMSLWNHKNKFDTIDCQVEEEGNNVVFYIHTVPASVSAGIQAHDFFPTVSPDQNRNVSDRTADHHNDMSICELIIKAHKGTFRTVITQNILSYIITLPLKENC